jgi:putative lipoprotein
MRCAFRRIASAVVSATFFFASAAIGDEKKEEKTAITGTIEFKDGGELPAGAIVVVQLLDVSIADAKAEVLGKQEIKDAKKFPIPFRVEYDPAKVKLRGLRYSIGVRITVDGKLAYINDTNIAVISNGAPTKDVKAPVIKIKR